MQVPGGYRMLFPAVTGWNLNPYAAYLHYTENVTAPACMAEAGGSLELSGRPEKWSGLFC